MQRPCGRSILSVAEVGEGEAVCWEMKTEAAARSCGAS